MIASLICDILDQSSPTLRWYFLHNSGQSLIVKLSSAVRLSGRDRSFGQFNIKSTFRWWVRFDNHSGSITRLWQNEICKDCKELIVTWSHWGKDTNCGKAERWTCFNFNLSLCFSWWSLHSSKSRLKQNPTTKVSNSGRFLTTSGKDF